MKKIFFIIALINLILVQAQTVYHYNMPCGSERYFESDSSFLIVQVHDSDMVLVHHDAAGIVLARYAGKMSSANEFFLQRDDEMGNAEVYFPEEAKLNFTTMDNKGGSKKIYFYTEVSDQKMIPFDYLCFTANRAIYFTVDEGKDSVNMFIQRRYPVPAKSLSKEDSLKFIEAILAPYKGLPNEFRYPEDMVKNADIMLIQDYTSMYEAGSMEPDYTAFWEINEDIDIVLNCAGLLGVVNSLYEYTGGAHGTYGSMCNVYDFTTRNIVGFDDIFEGDYEPALIKNINTKVREQLEIEEGESLSDRGFFVDEMPLTDNFCLYTNRIMFVYNIYEVAPYVVGSIEVEIPYTELKEFIKKNGPIDRLMNGE
ncbi:MAG: DUF3298 domain-containing protein [Bacteroidales bacterium]|nr:DUF3298 domain-containing protein [Bacteroidales bacterium]